jgi:catechol 2,3-dioxygenase
MESDMSEEPVQDLAHLGHHGLWTPDLGGTVNYFVDLLGMDVVGDQDDAVYLRAYGDYESWSLKVIASEQAGSAWVSWRTVSPQALRRRVDWLQAHGHAGEWTPPDRGIGPCYQFSDPDGHTFRLYYETQRYVPPDGKRPVLPSNFQTYAGRGANVRRLDHVNLLAGNVRACREFWEKGFGLRTYETVLEPRGQGEVASWMSSSLQGHELIYTRERAQGSGRLHHYAYVVDSREEVLRAADLFADARVRIEAGPSRHTAVQGFYLYTREPGGNRIEVANGGYLVFAPDAETVVWDADQWAAKPSWGAPLPPEFHIYGTPDVSGPKA